MNRENALKAVGEDSIESYSFETGPNVSLTEEIGESIRRHRDSTNEEEQERHRRRQGVYHASSYGCLRKRWYSWRGVVKSEWDSFPSGIGHRGEIIEENVEEALKEKMNEILRETKMSNVTGDVTIENEYPIVEEIKYGESEFFITGQTDPYVINDDDEVIEIIEVKSTLNIPDDPKWYHLWQLQTYLNAVGVENGTILYVNPSDWNVRVFDINKDVELWKMIKTHHALFHLYIRDNELPPKSPMESGECDGCPYRGHCMRDSRADEFTEERWPPSW